MSEAIRVAGSRQNGSDGDMVDGMIRLIEVSSDRSSGSVGTDGTDMVREAN